MQPYNASPIVVEPKDMTARPPQKKTRLYYVNVEFQKYLDQNSQARKQNPILVKSIVLTYPELGGSIFVPDNLVPDILALTRWNGQPTFLTEQEGGKYMAEIISEALEKGTPLGELDMKRAQAQYVSGVLSDEDLLTELTNRLGVGNVPKELLAKLKAAEEPAEQKSVPYARNIQSVGKNKKSEGEE